MLLKKIISPLCSYLLPHGCFNQEPQRFANNVAYINSMIVVITVYVGCSCTAFYATEGKQSTTITAALLGARG